MKTKSYWYQAVVGSLLLLLYSCGAVKPYYSKENRNWPEASPPPSAELVHSVFLIGDVGEPEEQRQEPSLKLLKRQLHDEKSADSAGSWAHLPDSLKSVVFLGDNIYLDGLSEVDAPDRKEDERRIIEQLKVVSNWSGKPVFIPGNHDWNFSRPGGLEAVIRQQQFIEAYLQKEEVYLPGNGCPGPYALPIGDKLVLIVLDSEWWLTKHRRPVGNENGCGVASELDMIIQLEDMLDRYQEKHIVLALHHPLMTNGNHGGHYSLGDHIFPLRLKYHNLYLPLPIVGSIYPLSRMYGLSRQDLANPKYRKLRDALFSVVGDRNNIVIAAGHEHSLQLHQYNDIMQIVSGAGCKSDYCVGGRNAHFVHKHEGFARINYYKNGESWVEFWEPVGDGSQGRCVFRKALYALATPDDEPVEKQEIPDYTDSLKTLAANPNFRQGSSLGRALWGRHYRQEWVTPVTVPYLDLERAKGGLKVLKRGGGQQTISLHLTDTSGEYTYYFRSIDKDPAGVLPQALQETFAEDFLKDQISSSHPYGALALPKMAEAAQVYYAKPELYYMPFTPSLGPFLPEFGGLFGLLELKADEDVSDYENFGNAQNAVGTRKLYEELVEDNDNEVNQESFLRARLFDMLIGDWDRHDGQWRWAEFEKEDKGSVYEPIPKDRDQVFVKYDGIIPYLFSRSWGIRKFQHFDYSFDDMIGLNWNAQHIDRRLLNELSWEDWEEQVNFLQEQLHDSIIEASIRDLPQGIFELSGPEIIAKLKARREALPSAIRTYYETLARYVDVVGSDKHEQFEVSRLPDGKTRVEVYKTKKDGELNQKIYERTFDPELTKEIRLYGLDGIDKFFVSGEAESAILLRIIAGKGYDILEDKSDIRGPGRTIVYYDAKADSSWLEAGPETRLRVSDRAYLNEYDYEEFSYPYFGPRLSAEFNIDDGLFLGGGFNLRTYGFRKKPAAAEHTLLANYAFNTGAYNFEYRGRFYDFFSHKFDLMVDGNINGPKYLLNYFGQGNDTPYERSIEYYRIRQNKVQLFTYMHWQAHEFLSLGLGPEFQYVDVGTERNLNTFIDSDDFRQSALYEEFTYMLGGRLYVNVNALNDKRSPSRGVRWNSELSLLNSLKHNKVNLTRLRSEFELYFSPNINLSPTLALRVGGQRNFGDFLFYQSASLGQTENLRGYRRNRFSGHSSLYQNAELRLPVSNLANYVFTGSWGVYGFIDHGRVWSRIEESDTWHRSYGPGLYLNLYNLLVTSGSVAFSKEGPYFLLNVGYFFD